MCSHTKTAAMPCLMTTWQHAESELYYWLFGQTGDADMSFDLLQDTFLRALQQQQRFCDIQNQRAWLYRVARNLVIDKRRTSDISPGVSVDEHEPVWESEDRPVVDSLAQCLPKALQQLTASDKAIIEQCDLQGMSQQDFATHHQLTLVATKSRLQRARKKLKAVLLRQCHIRFDEQQRVCCFYRE